MMNEEIKLLIFNLNGERYATDISHVERILGYEEPTELPDAPAFVKGVINHEGKILPIISLYNKFGFGLETFDENKKVVVITRDDKGYGIIVDNVYEVRSVKQKDFEKAPTIATKISARYMNGLIKLEDKIIILLDLAKILSEDEEEFI
ncbi:MAG: chemotaxis protein CheW [Clostridium sp.]